MASVQEQAHALLKRLKATEARKKQVTAVNAQRWQQRCCQPLERDHGVSAVVHDAKAHDKMESWRYVTLIIDRRALIRSGRGFVAAATVAGCSSCRHVSQAH